MKVLVVVDMQNDFIDGALGTPEAQAIVPKVVEKIRNVDRDTLVLLTKDTHGPDYLETLEGNSYQLSTVLREHLGGASTKIFHTLLITILAVLDTVRLMLLRVDLLNILLVLISLV